MTEILLGTMVFTGLVMALALVVLGARALIWGRGRARLTVNGEREIDSGLGVKLLGALHQGNVHLPTSCSGVGTCGLCRVQVAGAEDAALPVERTLINAHDLQRGYRLACQVVVRGDLQITVPPELLGAKPWLCTVQQTRTLSPLIKEIVLALPAGEERAFAAGCYVLINAPAFQLSFSDIEIDPAYEPTWQRMGLRALHAQSAAPQTRAYSLVNRPQDQDTLVLNIRLALPPAANPDAKPGCVSSYLFGLNVGDTVTASGPYGNFFVRDTTREMIFIGGGVGMAPLYAHAYDQLERQHSKRPMQYWYGARSLVDLYYAEEMATLASLHDNFSWHPVLSEPAPDDAWQGATGFVHEAVYRHYLSTHPAPQDCEYYLCGPPLMIRAVRAMLDKLGVAKDNIYSDDFGV